MADLTRSRWLAGATAVAAVPRPSRAQSLEKIQISAVPTDDMTPIFYAIHTGAYQKAGLDVEVVTTPSGSASTAAVVAGAYDLGKASPISTLLAHLHGLPLTIVANGAVWNPKSPFNLVVVAADSPIKTGADCNGKIGSAPGLNDTTQMGVLQWVDKNGGDSKTMRWVEIPGTAAATALAEHRIDITTLNEPYLSVALESGKVRPLGDAYTSIAEHWVASVYVSRPDWVTRHPDAVKRWVRVTYESAAFCNAHKTETAALMSDLTKIPLGVFGKMARIEGATAPNPALLQPVIALAAKYKAIPHAFPAREMYAG